MTKIFNKFLIVLTFGMFLVALYAYFSDGENAQAALSSSAIASSAESAPSVTPQQPASIDEKINSDTAFLASLISLRKINIDTTLFANDAFNALVDNNVKLEQTPSGRVNPFAPIKKDVAVLEVVNAPVTTNQPIQITDKTASLYGTVSNPASVSSVYFEYGPTPTLGKKTNAATLSLVGTFVTNVSSLTSKTVYFYRAVAKIGDKLVYGETISFFTN